MNHFVCLFEGVHTSFWYLFLRGGPSEFHISRFLTCKWCHTPILHLIYPKKVLKWPWVYFLWKSFFKIWPQFFGFGESPGPRKFFFSKIFFWNLNNSANFYPITLNSGLKWPENDFAENVGSRNCDFPRFRTFSNFFLKKWSFFWKKNRKCPKTGEITISASNIFCKIVSRSFKPKLRVIG